MMYLPCYAFDFRSDLSFAFFLFLLAATSTPFIHQRLTDREEEKRFHRWSYFLFVTDYKTNIIWELESNKIVLNKRSSLNDVIKFRRTLWGPFHSLSRCSEQRLPYYHIKILNPSRLWRHLCTTPMFQDVPRTNPW